MNLSIVPLAESHFDSLRWVFDSIAREKRYLAFLQAPPLEQNLDFYRNIVAKNLCHLVAVLDGEVVGWCDVLPFNGEARAHSGTLGIGLAPHARHIGIGAKLMDAAIKRAWKSGFSRIELIVRADNENAKTLYERFGFTVEGTNQQAFFVDGVFYDTYSMALLR